MQTVEEIPFERVRQVKATSQEKKSVTDVQSLLSGTNDKQMISGRCVHRAGAVVGTSSLGGSCVPLATEHACMGQHANRSTAHAW